MTEIPADVVVTNAIVYTVNTNQPLAEAVAIQDGRFVFVGSTADVQEFIDAETQVIDAGGAVMFPGFIDVHTHPLFLGEAFGQGAALLNVESLEEFRNGVVEFSESEAAAGFPFIRVLPWKYDFISGGRLPSATEIDDLFPELRGVPLLIQTQGGQEYLLNSRAIAEMTARNLTAFLQAGPARDAAGRFTGVLEQGAPAFDPLDFWPLNEFPNNGQQVLERMQTVFEEVLDLASSYGITGIDDQGSSTGVKLAANPNTPEEFRFGNVQLALTALNAGRLDNVRLRASLHVHQDDFLQQSYGDILTELYDWQNRQDDSSDPSFFELGTSIKLYIDGVGERQTAAFLEPYADPVDPNAPTGRTFYPTDFDNDSRSTAFKEAVQAVDSRGIQVSTHTVGDRASRIVIDAYHFAALSNGHDPADRRFRIEHNEYPTTADIPRLADDGIISVFTAAGNIGTQTTDDQLGLERTARFSPARDVLDAGAPVAFVSDFSVSPLSPMFQAFVATTRIHHDGTILSEDQAITLGEYIRGATLGAAFAIFAEDDCGSIEVGKFGDFVLFNPELFEFTGDEINFTDDFFDDLGPIEAGVPNSRLSDLLNLHFQEEIDLDAVLADDDAELIAGIGARLLNANRMSVVGGNVVYDDHAPVPVDDFVVTFSDATLSLDLTVNDTDADVFASVSQQHKDFLFVSDVTQPEHGTVVNLEGSVIYTPDPGFVGTDSFTYRVHDGAKESETVGTVRIVVGPDSRIDREVIQDDDDFVIRFVGGEELAREPLSNATNVVIGGSASFAVQHIDFGNGSLSDLLQLSFQAGEGRDLLALRGNVSAVAVHHLGTRHGQIALDRGADAPTSILFSETLLLGLVELIVFDYAFFLPDQGPTGLGDIAVLDNSNQLIDLASDNGSFLQSHFEAPLSSLTIHAGAGNDIVSATFLGPEITTAIALFGDDGSDVLFARSSQALLSGGPGNDELFGGEEGQTLLGGAGRDTIHAGGGNDFADGGEGNDSILGEAGNDTVRGSDGEDTIKAGTGTDQLFEIGDADFRLTNSRLIGLGETDRLTGIDTAMLVGGFGPNRIDATGFSGRTTLNGEGGADTLLGTSLNDELNGGDGDDNLSGNSGNDLITGGSGRDSINAGSGRDTVEAGAGDDTVFGGAGTDDLDGGADRDSLFGDAQADTLRGGDGNDTLDGGGDHDRLFGGDGDDSLLGQVGNDTLNGGAGHDTLDGGIGNDGLSGFTGNDLLRGQSGRDTLIGGTGSDTLHGGIGRDILRGDSDADLLAGENDLDTLTAGTGNGQDNTGDFYVSPLTGEINRAFLFAAGWIDEV